MKYSDRMSLFNRLRFYIVPFILGVSIVHSQQNQIEKPDNVLNVYYFRTNQRCVTCRKIEKYTRDVVESDYRSERKQGTVSFQMFNVVEKTNTHYIDDYKLVSKSVILSRIVGGKEIEWKNLDKIWILAGNENKFKQYIKDSINTMLEEVKQ
jgi:hypothetical protein